MAKNIHLTEEQIQQSIIDFQEAIRSKEIVNGEFTFKRSFTVADRKATVLFTPKAYVKMLSLIKEFSTEVAWYGVGDRFGDEADDAYIIYDIMVYPQSVSGAYVAMDEVEHAKWYVSLAKAEDPRINNLFIQCHSHVNMGVSPSGKDSDTIKTFLSQTSETGFFISMIWNKSLAHWINIFDKKKNIQFEDKDITVDVIMHGVQEDEIELASAFISESKKIAPSTSYYGNYGNYQGGGTYQYGNKPAAQTTPPAAPTAPKTVETKKTDAPKQLPAPTKKTEKTADGWKPKGSNVRKFNGSENEYDEESWYHHHKQFK